MKTVNLFLTSLIMLSSVSASAQQVVSENVFKDITTIAKVRNTRFAAPSPAGSLRKTGKPVAFYIGDSTMRTTSAGNGWNGQWGFGLFAQEWFDENELVVENHGWGGTTSETYYTGKWGDVKSGIKAGDYVVIDFGHNDKSGDVFVTYINKYIDEIQAKGATPILCSRTPRCGNGVPSADQTYRPLGMAIAQQRGIAYIDLEAQAMPMYTDFGTWKTAQFYQDGKLHTSLLGAWHNAYCHALAIAADPSNPLHQYLKDTTPAKMNIERKAGEHYTFSIGGDDTSARGTFRSGRWMLLYNTLEKGDTVLIQFGSNELKSITSSEELGCIQSAEESYQVTQMTATSRWETVYSYGWYIHYFLNDIEAKGAVGVLVNEDGTTPAKVAAWNEELANKYNVKVLEIDDNGSCGENLFYFFNEATGTLTISGTGAMQNYSNSSSAPWSSYKSDIKKLDLNEGVTSIGTRAFYGCSGLTSIEIPNSVTSIGERAFYGCSGLTSIEIPNSVTSIGERAFYGCSGLTSIEIPNSVTSIGTGAFDNCSGLTSIVIPNSVTSIGTGAFDNCSGLTAIEIPNSVTSIGSSAFYNCSGLTSIEIPNSVTSIGIYAFYNCSGLTSIVIPNSVTSIGNSAFTYCSGLTAINVESGNTKYDSRDNCNAIIEASSNTLVAGCKNTIIPNSVTSIGNSAFNGCRGLKSIEIPNSVTSIGDYAFSGCSGLKSIEIPNSVTSIGTGAFSGCSGLTSIVIPNSVTSIGTGAFDNCSGLTSIVIPNSVTSIGGSAFYNCGGLTSIEIPKSVTNIGNYAFAGCSGLTSVTCLAESVPKINSNVFYNSPISSATLCVPVGSKAAYKAADIWKNFKKIIEINDYGPCGDKLSYVYEEATGTLTISGTGAMSDYSDFSSVPWSSYCKHIKKIVLNDGVTSIGTRAFSGCSGLTSIEFPNSVTSINDWAFFGCSGLTSIVIPNSVTSIGGSAFYNCGGLTSIEIPKSVTNIGNYAFAGCSGLTSIEIPKSVTSIGNYVFYRCNGLTTINVESGNTMYDSRNNCNAIIETSTNTLIAGCKNTVIPKSVTSIGTGAFYLCSYLTSIEIPNSVTSIGSQAFENCSSLTSILIPNSVTSIAYQAFNGCSSLTSIVIPNSVTSIGGYAFSGCSCLTSINVESGNTKYDSRNNCNAIIEISSNTLIAGCKNTIIPNSVTSIGDWAFAGCSRLTSIEIPKSVTSIGVWAFSGCSSLTSIEIPNSVTSIGARVFEGCRSLTSIEIPNSVTTIGNYAFYDCSGLTSIVIPNSVTSIGKRAFERCSGLTSVTCLAESVPTINSNAFYDSSIESATLYVPAGSKAAYEVADVWKDFKKIVEIEVAPTPSSDALLSVQDTKGYIGKTVSADIDLTNSTEDLTAYQFDLTLPDGFSLSVNDKGKFLVTKTSRYEDDSQTLNISKLEGNTYRFVCFSMSNEVITGTSGAILNASLTIGESVNEGSYEATISNIVVTKTDGTQLKLSDSKFNIVVTNVIKGDANGDGEVNVSDIVEIVNYIMNKPSDKFVFAAADVNEDGEVNVTDIVKVVSIIMSANSSQAKMSAAQTEMTDNDQVQLVDNEDQTISLTLNNEGGYVASQFDLVLSDNQSLESITLNNNRTDNHILAYTKTGENRYRVLSYSLNNATYDGHSGELLDIKVAGNGDVSVEDILFVTAEETEKRFSPLHSGTTGISITTKQAEAMDIYSVDGRLVHKQAKSMDGLERGIYIINGKKHIAR